MKTNNVRKLTTMAMLTAISITLVYLLRFSLFLPFLEYDPADIPIFIGTFAFGPTAGLILTVVVSVIQGLTVSASSNVIGISMHIFATGGFVLVAGNVYKRSKTRKNALLALVLGSLAMTAMMTLWNIIFTPLFMKTSIEEVLPLLMTAIIPFNLIKAGINSAVTFMVYKTVSPFLQAKK